MNRVLFPAKIDWGVSVLLAVMAIFCFVLGIVCFFLPPPTYISGVLLLLTGALLQSIWMYTRYKIDEQIIRIQCGPIWWTVSLEDIYLIEKTSSVWLMMGGPHLRLALSKDGLMIRYRRYPGQKWLGLVDPAVLISPADRDQFLDAIRSARPDLIATADGNLELKEQ
ncbi:PH domain-containing protein [Bremerella sp.]|uniref:PH domain-containing protein n=1 Tax=Bremerella sp. TaxID=2795602 RepID=UPI003919F502